MKAHRALAPLLLLAALVLPAVAADRAKAKKDLEGAVAAGSSEGVQKACDELLEAGGKDSFTAIVALAPKAEGPIYWQLVGGASGLKDAPALEELGKWVIAHQADAKGSLARDLLFGLQNNPSPLVVGPLAAVLEKGKYDLQLMCVDQLAAVRAVEAVDALVAALKRELKGDGELKARILSALETLTGESLGAENWEGWWKTQRPNGIPAPKAAPKAGDKDAPASGTGTVSKPRDNEFNKTVTKLTEKRVVVLASPKDFDHMDEVLEKIKVPHTVVQRADFDADPAKVLKECYALLVNCNEYHEAPLKQESLDRIKAWVENDGGFLYTEDWAFIDVSSSLWPDKVTSGPKGNPRLIEKECHVKLAPGRGVTSHPLMRGVWQKPAEEKKPDAPGEKTVERVLSPARKLEHSWQIDALSAAIEIVDKGNVIVLLEAEEISKATGGNIAVAVTFRAGSGVPKKTATPTGGAAAGGKDRGSGEWSLASKGGRVLHTLSHWGHQPATEDGQALHNMLLNFLLEAAKRRGE